MVGITTLIIFLAGAAGLYFLTHAAPARAAFGGAAMAIAFVLPHLWFTKEIDGYLPLFTIVLCAVYALFALGLNIVVGFAGLLDLGYVAFFLVGAYVGAWLMSDFAVNVSKGLRTINIHFLDAASHKIPGIHLSFWIVVIIAGIVAALAGVVIGVPTLRLSSDY
jgi:branched-chain amino acid transport system permease protein